MLSGFFSFCIFPCSFIDFGDIFGQGKERNGEARKESKEVCKEEFTVSA